MELTTSQLRSIRLFHNGLLQPSEPKQVLEKTVGIQSQHLKMAELNLALRSEKSEWGELPELYGTKQVVRSWGQRWTHHLMTIEDWNLVINARKQEQLPINYYRGQKDEIFILIEKIKKRLPAQSSWQRKEIEELIQEIFPTYDGEGRFLHAILQELVAQGVVFFDGGSSLTNWILWVATKDQFQPIEPQTAISELILRYLKGFGPASIEDFVRWSGIKISRVRKSWQKIAEESSNYDWQGNHLIGIERYSSQKVTELTERFTMLGFLAARFDASLTGYVDKSWLILKEYQSIMWTVNGILMAPIFVEGEVVGHWNYRLAGKQVTFELLNWKMITPSFKKEIEEKLQKVADFLQADDFKVNYTQL
ncbi:winged helix DNA-binding domain-containing protein [Enterococcus songbeiensis]